MAKRSLTTEDERLATEAARMAESRRLAAEANRVNPPSRQVLRSRGRW